MTGYLHPSYAAAFAEWGRPRELKACGGWILEREIAGTADLDAMGCYPLFACRDWRSLAVDVEALAPHFVSLTLVTDPFTELDEQELRQVFPSLMRAYKEHFVVELGRPATQFVHPTHLRNAASARRKVQVASGPPTPRLEAIWCGLYEQLIHRHNIRGIAAFSPASFARQFRVPGLVVQWAEAGGKVVGMVLWYVAGSRVYYHLGAYSEVGYASKSSFALFLAALDHFSEAGLRWLVLGAGAGAANESDDGLTRFKRGWATDTRTVYLCGRVFDPERYDALRAARQVPADVQYFPAYRYGEFR